MARSARRYALLFALQAIGSVCLLFQCVPIYSRLLDEPGNLHDFDLYTLTVTLLGIGLIQWAYWYRVFNVALPINTQRVVIGHIILFTSRLGFIVASSLFSVVLFRHMPQIEFAAYWPSFLWRGALLLAVLFSLYCFTTELERLGSAMRGQERRAG
jgi:hypothetical protein